MHGTCGLNNPWHRTCRQWVGISNRPPSVIPRGSAGLKKRKHSSYAIILNHSTTYGIWVQYEHTYVWMYLRFCNPCRRLDYPMAANREIEFRRSIDRGRENDVTSPMAYSEGSENSVQLQGGSKLSLEEVKKNLEQTWSKTEAESTNRQTDRQTINLGVNFHTELQMSL